MPTATNRKQSNSDIWAFVGRGARRKNYLVWTVGTHGGRSGTHGGTTGTHGGTIGTHGGTIGTPLRGALPRAPRSNSPSNDTVSAPRANNNHASIAHPRQGGRHQSP